MSSLIIAIPMLPLAGAGIALVGVGMVGAGVGVVIKAIVDKRVEAAHQKMAAEKRRIREWQVFQSENRKRMEEMHFVQAAIREAEKKLSSMGSLQVREDGIDNGPTGKGYMSLGMRKQQLREDLRPFLEEIHFILERLPSRFKDDEGSPYKRLEKQRTRLVEAFASGCFPAMEEILSFRETITRSYKSYFQAVALAARKKEELCDRLDTLLNDILAYRELTSEGEPLSRLNSLQEQILTLAESGDIKPGHVDLLEKRFAAIRTSIECRVSNSAYRLALTESLTRNLGDMGYDMIEGFEHLEETARATVAIPDGESVCIAIEPDNRMVFEVVHASDSKEGLLNEENIAFFRLQEERWCRDYLELAGRMTKEGFSYQVKIERCVADDAIPVVVVETATEILAMEAEDEEIESRRFDDPKERYFS